MSVLTDNPRRGKLVISFDLELAWGAIESDRWGGRERNGVYENTRTATRKVLDALDRYEIPATFAIVGGMLERPGEWALDHLPESSRDRTWNALRNGRENSFHGPDMLDMIDRARVAHPVGSHSYAHTRYRYPGATAEFVTADLAHFRRVLPAGINAAPVLVFPNNDENFHAEVRASGFCAVRGRDPEPRGRAGWQRQLNSLFATPQLSTVTDAGNGLLRNTGSVQFISGARRRLFMVERLARMGLARAVHEGGTLHVWNHPFNMAETKGLLDAFIHMLQHAAELRDRGLLETGNMETGPAL